MPVMTGATVPEPSSVTFVGVVGSLTTSSIELAEATVEPSAGVEERRIGAVLSIRMLGRVSWDVLPSESDTTARRSYRPSGTDVVSNAWLHGAAVSVPIGVHAFAPAGLTEKATYVAPFPVTVALSVTVFASGEPGFESTTVGAVASTCTVTVPPVNVLPAWSAISGRRS